MSRTDAASVTADARRSRIGALRARVRSWPGGRLAWRIGVTLAGVIVVGIGIVLLPLPGPGWLIIFAGLGILSSEYAWAARLLRWVRATVLRWTRWLAGKPVWVRLLAGLVTLVLIAALVLAAWFVPF